MGSAGLGWLTVERAGDRECSLRPQPVTIRRRPGTVMAADPFLPDRRRRCRLCREKRELCRIGQQNSRRHACAGGVGGKEDLPHGREKG